MSAEDCFLSFGIGILSSAVVAITTIFFVFWIWKPKIEISKIIVKQKTDDGNYLFKIKFINKSRFPANDVRVELWDKKEYYANNNDKCKNEEIKRVELSSSEWLSIPKYESNKKVEKNLYAQHCVTVRIKNDEIESILSDTIHNQSLLFEISVKHGLSNISKTFSMEYINLKCIKEGKFIFGNSLNFE